MEDIRAFTFVIQEIQNLRGDDACREFESKYKKFDSAITKEAPKPTEDDYCELIKCALQSGSRNVQDVMLKPILSRKKWVNWKQCPEKLASCLVLISEQTKAKKGNVYDAKEIFEAAKRDHIDHHESIQGGVLTLIRAALTVNGVDHPLHRCVFDCRAEIPWKAMSAEKIKQVIHLIHKVCEKHYSSEMHENGRCCFGLLMFIFRETRPTTSIEISPDLAKLFNFLHDKDYRCEDNPNDTTLGCDILHTFMRDYYIAKHRENAEVLKPVMDSIKYLWECGDPELERDADTIMKACITNPELLGDAANILIDRYLNEGEMLLILQFSEMYKQKPELFKDRIDEFTEVMVGAGEAWVKPSTGTLYMEVAKDHPEYLTDKTIQAMVQLMEDDDSVAHTYFMTFAIIAERQPEKIVKHDKRIMNKISDMSNIGFHGVQVLTKLATKCPEKTQEYMDFIASRIDSLDGPNTNAALYNMKVLGEISAPALTKHRKLLDKLYKDPAAKICAEQFQLQKSILFSLATVHQAVQEQKGEIGELDDRLDDVEDGVGKLEQDVQENKEGIAGVKQEVRGQGERLDELEEVVDETVDKVEELDHKTLSHAPAWSRDVAELINEEGDGDWRLLSKRLGYTNDDIRNWATQPNPALSMFDEWFATHKTREATHAIQKNLEEMNRIDAAEIVERALAMAENVVEDSDDEELGDTPSIFISYQWGYQQEVKMLKKHLEQSGYKAWMDVGQMGGGDKLYAKIDQGIRAAQVVISCVSKKYAQSPNCNKEVGKPIIPLLMEKMHWPPPGTMGPIFSEYIFIRFFQRKGEETGDERYWPDSKFNELLMQLRFTLPPDESIISQDSKYKNWWNPPEEVLDVRPREQKEELSERTDDSAEQPRGQPDVFISYQWDKQPQIKALYRRLSQMGFSCWLDIMQMGGGDSLYDKIDKGIRGCHVVLSCVTSKYSMSANCRPANTEHSPNVTSRRREPDVARIDQQAGAIALYPANTER
ncbi:hypothetical protein CAPTEDRAFT_195141 [Capitella teleta]|uniref:Death domain-containing protein n=1 Tax=Capitella teleta TaxID=283909 RepID=R7VKN5_CAPTE|nr:hypothetical protein CAPTEDRAFT_195141 [Capitella teleta]|eukprot:ELU16910.1 hypothetical protein CAPTEDRAFT_195141 [Capitella teleta]